MIFFGVNCCTLFHTQNEEKSQKISTCIRITHTHTRIRKYVMVGEIPKTNPDLSAQFWTILGTLVRIRTKFGKDSMMSPSLLRKGRSLPAGRRSEDFQLSAHVVRGRPGEGSIAPSAAMWLLYLPFSSASLNIRFDCLLISLCLSDD